MKILSKFLFMTVLFSFVTFNSSAKVDNYVQNYRGGHGGGHGSHGEHTGTHGEYSHHEGHGEQQEHANLSSPDPSFYSQFTNSITPCHDAQYEINLCDSENNYQ
ncbi:hypothetical protein [Arsenophonus nasoniae]|uniref:Uncharacterized protein n=2 Tax=Arsenophonus nasoniae TaxID=638 RepID=D2TZH6_9GAMM|nr:hypothetical protein [Arsenophonus nasoniae]QBY42859.1 hypothetical protein ArsFIN_14200 [Arsenophonus nasoniae]WGM02679.1 hypothetical protein QE210_06270 [Arsenophonus nasoniae]WGM06923.1 hypothetical protein QE258_06465 [Arsenophonus nasoniae]CBA73048.1 hypothetical protein ARN_15890 [Arsenophonus nasoniae]